MFEFLKYTVPIWYYRLHDRSSLLMYSDRELEELEVEGVVTPYDGYRDPQSRRMDMAYQALQSGAIPGVTEDGGRKNPPTVGHVTDNYLFLRRHFAGKWSLYAYLLRLLTLHNPVRETRAFLTARGVGKTANWNGDLHRGYESHTPPPEYGESLVSVIIPTLNRYPYLKDVLDDLEAQDHRKLEVIVCDQSDPFQGDLYKNRRFPVKVIRQSEKALWMARNECFKASSGRFILLFDDDSRVGSDWVSQHLRCLSFFHAKVSAGVTDTVVGHGLSEKEDRFHLSDVFDTGNAMVRREVFEKVGLFDRQFEKQRMGDGEFGLRAYLGGYALISNPYAKRVHLKVDTGGLRHFGSWDAFRPGRLFAPRPVPSVLYLSRRYFGNGPSLFMILNSLPSSTLPYRYKGDRRMKRLAPLLTLLLSPVLAVQVWRSWRLSGRMIAKGPAIEFPVVPAENVTADVNA
jgi:hypothetical protein